MRARTHARSYIYIHTRTQFVQTNGLTTRSSSIWREDSRSGGSSRSQPVGRRARRAQPGWCRSRAGSTPMGAGTEDAIGLEPARRGGTAGSRTSPGPNYTYVSACARTLAHTVDREQYSQTNANANAREHK